ncbi:hypothetical protein NPA07_02435 [Mycoplasmopsis caviae]|uniref:Transposase n=1 Tax=Mycoplasmopsis caviae TaxID=55603 RepID=A0ABY5IXS1_9BACT|nr:hypothetical protein [Mycoplasmopsis caviae]UUD34903.1 hypothetical protein NPA07_03770 [Mycoplasmopsis caviae]UUD35709.1 hypothetical protein NPA07_02435 [Mycoplasmopsis caviae]
MQRWIGTFFHTNGINCFEDFLGKIELLIDEYNKQFKKAEAVSKNQMFLESQILKFLKKRWIL